MIYFELTNKHKPSFARTASNRVTDFKITLGISLASQRQSVVN